MRDPREAVLGGWKARVLVYFVFVVWCACSYAGSPGDDLSSFYVGSRLVSGGMIHNLYDHNPTLFHIVDSEAWRDAANRAGFKGFLHPYVQIPLLVWLLQPVSSAMPFHAFNLLFIVLGLVSLVVIVETCLRCWAPGFKSVIRLVPLLVAVGVMVPFQYAMWLVQTHLIFLALTLLALVLAERGRPGLSGGLLAVAAAVKLTPGFLVFYWLVKGRYRAAGWFAGVLVGIALLNLAVAGPEVFLAYIGILRRVSNVLLVSYNNQSLAAWWGYDPSLAGELGNWTCLEMPATIKAVSTAALVFTISLAGFFSRRAKDSLSQGASVCMALVAMTVFPTIAWTHYYVVLVPVGMVLVQAGRKVFPAVALLLFVLNIVPFAVDPTFPVFLDLSILRSQLVSAAVALAALLVLMAMTLRSPGSQASAA